MMTADARPALTADADLTTVIDAYLAELLADGVPDPLAQPFTLAAVLEDLCRLAGCPVPLAVAATMLLAAGEPVSA